MRTPLPLSIALLLSAPVDAATIHVPGDVPTLAWAVNVAQFGDSVVVAPGSYSGPGWAGLTQAADLVFITSSGGRDATTIDLGNTFFVEATSDVRVDGFTISGGTSDALLDINPGFVFIQNCRFVDSPGVIVDAESTTMTNTIVERCRRAVVGLSIAVTDCTFEDITEPVLEVFDGDLTATGCVFTGSGSHAVSGTNNSTITLTSCDVSNGEDVAITGVQNGSITLNGSNFIGNAGELGSVARVGSFVTLAATDCVFASNSASISGGVVSLVGDFSDAVFQNCSIVGNDAPSGAVVSLELADANSEITFDNSILVSNTGGELVSGPFGPSNIAISCTDAWNNEGVIGSGCSRVARVRTTTLAWTPCSVAWPRQIPGCFRATRPCCPVRTPAARTAGSSARVTSGAPPEEHLSRSSWTLPVVETF